MKTVTADNFAINYIVWCLVNGRAIESKAAQINEASEALGIKSGKGLLPTVDAIETQQWELIAAAHSNGGPWAKAVEKIHGGL